MLKKILRLVLLGLIFTIAVAGLPAAAAPGNQGQWVDLATSVDTNGNPVVTKVFGYYVNITGYGQVFVVCDPNTGQETGDAFVPSKIGIKQIQKLVRYDEKQVLDWDHPKEVKAVQISLFMPNIPTRWEYDWDYYNQTGQLRHKGDYQFGWPAGSSFAQMVPGSDPDYWLIVATLINPNDFPVQASATIRINEWSDGYMSAYNKPVAKDLTVSLGPNETRFVLINRGHQKSRLMDMSYDFPAAISTAQYNVDITGVNDPEYPDILKSGGQYGYYTTYVTWNGTNPTVYPLIPMRLAYDFYVSAYDSSNWYYGRGFPRMIGHAEYDPEKDDWAISLSLYDNEKPWYWSDSEWQQYKEQNINKAVSELKFLFRKWYPQIPHWDPWWKDPYLQVNGDTGEYKTYGNWPNNRQPSFVVTFTSIYPVPPSNAPPAPGSQSWWSNTSWGGWMYTTRGPYSSGYELSAPALVSYDGNYYGNIPELNWSSYYMNAYAGTGTFITIRATDPQYYFPGGSDWMNIFPVLRAYPLFTEKYTFISTGGDFGYLKKDTAPGYVLYVDYGARPVVNRATRPLEITATCQTIEWRQAGTYGGEGYYAVTRNYRWTPAAGWQALGESLGNRTFYNSYGYDQHWSLQVRYAHTITAANSRDFPVTWRRPYGGGMSFYWENADRLKAALTGLASVEQVWVPEHYDPGKDEWVDGHYEARPMVQSIAVDPNIPGSPGPISLGPGETKYVTDAEQAASIQFIYKPRYYPDFTSVLNMINTNVLPILNGQGEAVFSGDTVFDLGSTFQPGSGGVICGAQMKLAHSDWRRESEPGYGSWYTWTQDYYLDTIGFPNPLMSPLSYFTTASPTGGQVVRPSDELFSRIMGDLQHWWDPNWIPPSREIYLNGYTPVGSRYWRYYYNGMIYPPDRPDD
ncbi:hypothetical protein [Neomoorella thermoacetica]|uniref:hypothetical protein n=1 Tax=Neomoorella thermoacetica TaxID=1525 RepID=UPI0008FB9EEF|nr:hypothetical protein [Moorella thermoacetica]APC08605.1 hypothetical protein MTJW_14460 [Moorella thermoacetica]